MLHDATKCVPSMFMIYECKGCACKLISYLAEENKSLTAAGENKSLTAEDKKSLATVGDLKILDNSCGDVGILHVLKLEY